MIYNLYIFDRHCQCIFYTEWNRNRTTAGSRAQTDSSSLHEATAPYVWPTAAVAGMPTDARDLAMPDETKLVYGVVFSLRNMVSKLSHTKESDGFLSYRTNTYKLHYFETASGLKFVMLSDPTVPSLRDVLKQIYYHIYIEYVVKNALLPHDPKLSYPISNDYFRAVLNNYIKGLPCYQS